MNAFVGQVDQGELDPPRWILVGLCDSSMLDRVPIPLDVTTRLDSPMLFLLTQIEPLVRQFGLPGLFADVFLEALGLPLPGETLIIIASGLAGMGQLNIYAIALTVFAAAVAGDNIGYLIGRKLGRPLIVKYGSRFGVTQERLEKVEDLIQKRGPLLVASARFFVVLRQLNGIAAGTAGMHWLKFLAANAVGAALWVGFWTTLAYHFGKDASVLPHFVKHLSVVALFVVAAIALLLAVGWFLMRRWNRHSS